jgi:hypothetical protein
MFAMDPVFPGLGGLDNLDQPLLDQTYIPNWDTTTTTTNNNDTNHTQNIQSQSQPVHPTFLPNQQRQSHNQPNEILATPGAFDVPGTPWSTWLQEQGQGQGQTLDDGSGSGKKTMSSSEVYKKVVKP